MIAALRQLRVLLDRRSRTEFAVMFAAMLGTAVLAMAGVAAILPFMNLVGDAGAVAAEHPRVARVGAAIGITTDRGLILGAGATVLVIFTLSTVASIATLWIVQRCVWSMAHRLCVRLIRHYASLPYRFHLGRNSVEMTKKVIIDVNDVVTGVLVAGTEVVAHGAVSLLILGLMVAVEPVVALVAFTALGGAYGLAHLLRARSLQRLGRERLVASEDRLTAFTEAMTGTKAIRIEGAAPFFIDRFEDASRRFTSINPKFMVARQAPRYVIELIAFGGLVVVVLVILARGGDLAATIPSLVFFAVASLKLLPALNRVFQAAAQITHHLPVVDDVVADLRLVPVEPPPVEGADPGPDIPFAEAVRLDAVTFAYGAGDEPVLAGVDLQIPRGTSVALIGPTGSGKTTIVDVLLGLLPPDTGALRVDGTAITPATAAAWRRRVAYVPQDIFLYDDTLVRNIAFGVPEAEVDLDRVRTAAELAHLAEFVDGLPEGWSTRVGERGVRLSGGQRQRVGLARAFYRRPDLLVLDEATSALDSVTEAAVLEAVRTGLPGVTVLMIAHRLTTIQHCDCIHVVDRGRITGSGDWDHLRRENADVRTMVEAAS